MAEEGRKYIYKSDSILQCSIEVNFYKCDTHYRSFHACLSVSTSITYCLRLSLVALCNAQNPNYIENALRLPLPTLSHSLWLADKTA